MIVEFLAHVIKVAKRNGLDQRNVWNDEDTSLAKKITIMIAMKGEKSLVRENARDPVPVTGKRNFYYIYSFNSISYYYRDRSDRKRDKRDRSRSRDKRRDKDKKERKPEFDIKIKEEPVDGKWKYTAKITQNYTENYLSMP